LVSKPGFGSCRCNRRHGIFDFFHHLLIVNAGVPHWWPGFCMAFDVVAGLYLAILLLKRPGLSRDAPEAGK
jgi:hypothetical protein